jgi:hypothetical protein
MHVVAGESRAECRTRAKVLEITKVKWSVATSSCAVPPAALGHLRAGDGRASRGKSARARTRAGSEHDAGEPHDRADGHDKLDHEHQGKRPFGDLRHETRAGPPGDAARLPSTRTGRGAAAHRSLAPASTWRGCLLPWQHCLFLPQPSPFARRAALAIFRLAACSSSSVTSPATLPSRSIRAAPALSVLQ